MVSRRADKNTEAGVLPTMELVDAMLKYEDFGPALTPAHREQVRRLKDGVSKK